MISITKLNDQQIIINSSLIELIEATPDTTITLTTGRKMIVKESVDEVVNRIQDYKKHLV